MVLLTFNILRSDYFKKDIEENETIKIISADVMSILQVLEIYSIKCTFFCETLLLLKLQPLLKSIVQKGHELSIYNLQAGIPEIAESKKSTEDFLEKYIRGIRQKDVRIDENELKLLEFSYISNLEFTNIHLPFKKLTSEATIIEKKGISFIPESVSSYSHFPYNDLLFQLAPQHFYNNMVFDSFKKSDFVMIYLNSFQFTNPKYFENLAFYRRLNTGKKMEDKLAAFLEFINEREIATARIKDFVF